MANKLASKPIATLKGHTSMPCRRPSHTIHLLIASTTGAVNALTFSGGAGTYLLSGSSDRTIRLWNPSSSTSTAVQTYSGVHGHEVLAIAVSSDNSRFASAGAERTVFLWDVASARTTRRFGGGAGGHGARVEAVAFAGDGDGVLASGGVDGSVRLWDCRSQNAQPIMVLGEARDAVSCVGVCDAEVFAGSVDGRVRCYDVRMGVLRVDVVGSTFTVSSVLEAHVTNDAFHERARRVGDALGAGRDDARVEPGLDDPVLRRGDRAYAASVLGQALRAGNVPHPLDAGVQGCGGALGCGGRACVRMGRRDWRASDAGATRRARGRVAAKQTRRRRGGMQAERPRMGERGRRRDCRRMGLEKRPTDKRAR